MSFNVDSRGVLRGTHNWLPAPQTDSDGTQPTISSRKGGARRLLPIPILVNENLRRKRQIGHRPIQHNVEPLDEETIRQTENNDNETVFTQEVTPPSDESGRPRKRQKKSAAEDLICPITRELPVVPVLARDGRIYEESAIRKHFDSHSGQVVKSPMTNEMILKEVFPSPQIKNLIETLIQSETITGDLAKTWTTKIQELNFMKEVLEQAKKGDVTKMELAGYNYKYGIKGYPEDPAAAYYWFEKARKLGGVIGLAHVGDMLANGFGVTRNKTQGVMYLMRAAAEKGSQFACFKLGVALAEGNFGLAVDKADAIVWLNKALRRSTRDFLSEADRGEARRVLAGLEFSQE